MYCEELITIGRTDDDKFLVSIKQKQKPKKESNMVHIESDMKTFVADNIEDVGELISKHLPDVKKGKDSNEAFKEGFNK